MLKDIAIRIAEDEINTILKTGYSRENGVKSITEDGVQYLKDHDGYIESLFYMEKETYKLNMDQDPFGSLERFNEAKDFYRKITGHDPGQPAKIIRKRIVRKVIRKNII